MRLQSIAKKATINQMISEDRFEKLFEVLIFNLSKVIFYKKKKNFRRRNTRMCTLKHVTLIVNIYAARAPAPILLTCLNKRCYQGWDYFPFEF
jgi:hypothetical protein